MSETRTKRVVGTVLFVGALLAVALFIFVLFANANNIDVLASGQPARWALATGIILSVAIVALIVTLIVRGYADALLAEETAMAAAAEPEPMREPSGGAHSMLFAQDLDVPAAPPVETVEIMVEPEPEPEPVVYDIHEVAVELRSWGKPLRDKSGTTYPYSFPRDEAAGVYMNDYIDIGLEADGSDAILKLRLLLAGPADFPPETPVTPIEEAEEAPAAQPAAAEAPKPKPRSDIGSAPRSSYQTTRTTTTSSRSYSDYRRSEPARPRRNDDFIAELDARFRAGQTKAAPAAGQVTGLTHEEPAEKAAPAKDVAAQTRDSYHGYVGSAASMTDLVPDDAATSLRSSGVHTAERLLFEDAGDLASRSGLDTEQIRTWQGAAELTKVKGLEARYATALAAAGVRGVKDLMAGSAEALARQVNEAIEDESAQRLTSNLVTVWQDAAKQMERVRLAAPES